MPKLTTEKATTHTLTLTDAELAEWREAALCALDLGGDKDEHAETWRTISRLGLPATRGTLSDQPAKRSIVGTTKDGRPPLRRGRPEPWSMDHQLHVLIQIEARAGQPNDKGERWMERRLTGEAIAVCSCGYSTGLVDSSSLPNVEELAAQHPRTA